MKRTIVTLALALGLLSTVLAGSASAATATITSPSQGASVAPGLRGVTVDVTEGGTLAWSLVSDDYEYDESGSVTVEPGRTTIAVPVVNHVGTYTFTLEDSDFYGSYDEIRFRVAAPPRLSSATASPSTFFPVVRDRYRDSVRFAFRTNTPLSAVGYEVRDSAYKVVTRGRIGARGTGVVSWSWNGRTANGAVLPTGSYTIKATALTAAEGRTLTVVSPRITSRTAIIKQRVQLVRYGDDPSSLSNTDSCFVSEYDGTLDLDCWGFGDSSAFARARYDFSLPSNATSVVWRVSGVAGCCDDGVIRRTGVKSGARGFRVEVYVSESRSFTVNHATVTYTTAVRR